MASSPTILEDLPTGEVVLGLDVPVEVTRSSFGEPPRSELVVQLGPGQSLAPA